MALAGCAKKNFLSFGKMCLRSGDDGGGNGLWLVATEFSDGCGGDGVFCGSSGFIEGA